MFLFILKIKLNFSSISYDNVNDPLMGGGIEAFRMLLCSPSVFGWQKAEKAVNHLFDPF